MTTTVAKHAWVERLLSDYSDVTFVLAGEI